MFLQDYKMLGRKEYSPQIFSKTQNEGQKLKINLRPKTERSSGLRRKPPKLAKKNKGGAPKGNRNALKTGLHTGEMSALKAKVRRVIAETKLAAALVRAEAARMDAETRPIRPRAAEPAPVRIAPLQALKALRQIAYSKMRSPRP